MVVSFIPIDNDLKSQNLDGFNVLHVDETTTSNTYIPPPSMGVEYREVDIQVNFRNDFGTWPAAAMGAFEFAVDIWENTLTSTEVIEIDAFFAILGPGVLGGAAAVSSEANFASAEPRENDVAYPSALANKLAHNDLNPSDPDIECFFQRDFSWSATGINWYFGTDGMTPANQIDFVTVILHELCHGLGFASSVRQQSGTIRYEIDGNPNIYDLFLLDGTATRLIDLATPSTALTNFATSQDLFWDGINAVDANASTNPMIHAPTPFEPGSSISHWDEVTYPPGHANSLMTPQLGLAEAIHDPGMITEGLMHDIGWDLDISTGIEDELKLTDGPSILDLGDSFTYSARFIDEPPTSFLSMFDWKMELLHQDGKYIVRADDDVTPFDWNDQMPFFIPPLVWSRNADNTIKGYVTVSGTDSDGIYHEAQMVIGVRYAPNPPLVQLTSTDCSHNEITFFSAGTTEYEIFYDNDQSGAPYDGTDAVGGNSGGGNHKSFGNTYTLKASNHPYYISVRATNQFGTSNYGNEISTSDECVSLALPDDEPEIKDEEALEVVSVSPNPFLHSFIFSRPKKHDTLGELVIQNRLGQTLFRVPIQEKVSEQKIDLSTQPSGIYFLSYWYKGKKQLFKLVKI